MRARHGHQHGTHGETGRVTRPGRHRRPRPARRVRTRTATMLASALVALAGLLSVLVVPAAAAPAPSPGDRIVAVAKRYVGKARYVEGGASPRRGFDCSGFTYYAYRYGKVAWLPHNAEQQRHFQHMRRIPAAQARPGDLVFYLDGGRAYHVAIYAGHHMQYAAATPRDGIRYQRVWSNQVEYRTDWH